VYADIKDGNTRRDARAAAFTFEEITFPPNPRPNVPEKLDQEER
jgi:hypothetical protein